MLELKNHESSAMVAKVGSSKGQKAGIVSTISGVPTATNPGTPKKFLEPQ